MADVQDIRATLHQPAADSSAQRLTGQANVEADDYPSG
jgi:hypothetical protein